MRLATIEPTRASTEWVPKNIELGKTWTKSGVFIVSRRPWVNPVGFCSFLSVMLKGITAAVDPVVNIKKYNVCRLGTKPTPCALGKLRFSTHSCTRSRQGFLLFPGASDDIFGHLRFSVLTAGIYGYSREACVRRIESLFEGRQVSVGVAPSEICTSC